MFDQIVQSCQFLLESFPDAQECRDYLDSRLTKESQKIFKFGYFPPAHNLLSLTSLIGQDSLRKTNLFYSKNIEDSLYPRTINVYHLEGYPLILPFHDAYGKIIALVGRSLLTESDRNKVGIPKYKNTIFMKGHHLFGLYENKNSIILKDSVYVVEGQFDLIKAVGRGITNIVALGNYYMTPYQFSVITRYTNNIVLLLDNDEAGGKGRKRIVEKFGKLANISNQYIPTGYKDIDEYLSKNGDAMGDGWIMGQQS